MQPVPFLFSIPVGSGHDANQSVLKVPSEPTSSPIEYNSVVWALCDSGQLSYHKRDVKRRLAELHLEGLSTTTQLNIIGAVGVLECWMTTVKKESRKIESLPAQDFDLYLMEFFPLLKRRNRQDYDPDSFTNFRSFIARFLREKKYPYSIQSSAAFTQSQLAFKSRRKQLERSAAVRRIVEAKRKEQNLAHFQS